MPSKLKFNTLCLMTQSLSVFQNNKANVALTWTLNFLTLLHKKRGQLLLIVLFLPKLMFLLER